MNAPPRNVVLPRPLAYQQEVLDDDHRFKILDLGRQAGKTTFAGLALTFGHGPKGPDGLPIFQGVMHGKVGQWVAPTLDLADISWRRLKEWFSPIWGDLRKSDVHGKEWVEFPGGGRLTMRTAADPDKLVGDTVDFLVFDEAARCKARAWELAQPMLTIRHTERMKGLRPGGGWAIVISTPKGRNWFYKEWKRGRRPNEDTKSWRWPSTINPLFSEEERRRYKKKWEPYLYEREILARFTVADGSFFRRSWFQDAADFAGETFLSASLPIDEESRGEIAEGGSDSERHLVVGTWRYSVAQGLVLVDLFRERVRPAEIPVKLSEIGAKSNATLCAVAHLEPLASMAKRIGATRRLHPMQLVGVYDSPGFLVDPVERAGLGASAVMSGRMRFVEADWREEFFAELFSFPDQEEERSCVEMISLAARRESA